MSIALSALNSWNLKEVIPSVKERIDRTKMIVRNDGIVIQDTNDLDQYIKGVKYNIDLFYKT